jgi:hypothetical protein
MLFALVAWKASFFPVFARLLQFGLRAFFLHAEIVGESAQL